MENPPNNQPVANQVILRESTRIAVGTKEASELLGVSRNTLYAWVHAKKVPHIRVGGHILFSVKRLEAWVASYEGENHTREDN